MYLGYEKLTRIIFIAYNMLTIKKCVQTNISRMPLSTNKIMKLPTLTMLTMSTPFARGKDHIQHNIHTYIPYARQP